MFIFGKGWIDDELDFCIKEGFCQRIYIIGRICITILCNKLSSLPYFAGMLVVSN